MKVSERTCNSFLNKYPRSLYEPHIKSLLGDIFISEEKYSFALEQLLSARQSKVDSIFIKKIDILTFCSINKYQIKCMIFTLIS